jgi:hypothetical protein
MCWVEERDIYWMSLKRRKIVCVELGKPLFSPTHRSYGQKIVSARLINLARDDQPI